MDSRSEASASSGRTTADPSADVEKGGRSSSEVEKGSPTEGPAMETEDERPLERDEDGIAIENGVPLLRLKGPDDPLK